MALIVALNTTGQTEAARTEAKQFALRKEKTQQMVNERMASEAAKEGKPWQ